MIGQDSYASSLPEPQQQGPVKTVNTGPVKIEGYVNKWFFVLKTMCLATLFFVGISITMARLDEYDSEGKIVKEGLSLSDLPKVDNLLKFGTPSIIALVILLVFKPSYFKREMYNVTIGMDGQRTGAGEVSKEVFSSVAYAGSITFTVVLAWMWGFSMFFESTKKCKFYDDNKQEDIIDNLSFCGIYNTFGESVKLVFSVIIIFQISMLIYRFYKSMPLGSRRAANNQAKRGFEAAKRIAPTRRPVQSSRSQPPGRMVNLSLKDGKVRNEATRKRLAANQLQHVRKQKVQQQEAAKKIQAAIRGAAVRRQAAPAKAVPLMPKRGRGKPVPPIPKGRGGKRQGL